MRKFTIAAATVALGLSGVAMAGTAVAAPTGAAGTVTPNSAACGHNGPNNDPNTGHATTAANIRNGSSTSCPAVGAAQPGDVLDYYCYTSAGSYTWTFVRDTRTGTIGWIRDDLLSGNGSYYYCGF
ncbi:hypothetical protein AMES_3629 [Amycolatopsis mediterranei S699]|uniref:SH3b domain-containing protein n=2 Tax=Amycolatopsis mediterranei TaxID=33910 RepID=A0A0H3D5S1_AMYMU|nr:SH3 domain-containing protein [Amycolatopsis mediterranei]ADJ45453.1 hypothetical protein AMED_3670 [Amycolatopsis mediterranei U32]AEK42222.1 hypothetical protein RAM_18680 [Amycolatopsis mediterranei S699]AFO77165.1 hypothetical protein AMES_3629 [Amycolatopsis mediterranei S699]AGT84293.1 hypothetical protein B737_3629 [Amycolatopsis mediterranei RB]KDO06033.1 hypothetical protein DV26_35690 [Amycolatopsis mediterranei]